MAPTPVTSSKIALESARTTQKLSFAGFIAANKTLPPLAIVGPRVQGRISFDDPDHFFAAIVLFTSHQ